MRLDVCLRLICVIYIYIPKKVKNHISAKVESNISVLSFVGEKLDYKSCESLEEIFKRVQFKVVDLEQTNLDEDVSAALFYPVEFIISFPPYADYLSDRRVIHSVLFPSFKLPELR